MFTQENIKKTILGLEEKYPVDSWIVDGIHVWPYIRIKLYIHMLVLMNKKPINSQNNTSESKKEKQDFKIFKKTIQLIKAKYNLILFFSKLNPKRIIFFGSHIHRVFQDGKYFNRFYDSMVDCHSLQNDVYVAEYQKIVKPLFNEKAVIPLNEYLNYYKLINKITSKFKNKKQKVVLNEYDNFYKDVLNLNLDYSKLKLTRNDITHWAKKINANKNFFVKLYKKVKPQKVIFLGYYGLDDLYAALVAANKLNIKTIDFQHGPQTNVHLAFSNWNKISNGGYNTMPKEFWNWDEESENNINLWANKTINVTAKVVGQPYLAYWNEKNKNELQQQKDIIFYSLQTYPFTIEDLLTTKIIALIKNSKHKWVLRLHPRNNLDLSELKSFIVKNQIKSKVEIQDAYKTPLPKVLTSSLLHITNYSGCLIEAMQLGVPTILINEVGKEMFNNYIDNKQVYYFNQESDGFISNFDNVLNSKKGKNFIQKQIGVFNPLS